MKAILKMMLAACALVAPSAVLAQDYPSRQVTVVVPFPPGGSNDTLGRYVADRLKEFWKTTVIVENRPGAGSAIGTAHVVRAKPDGYTLLFISNSFTTNAATQKNLPFDPVKDLQPTGLAALGDRFVLSGSRLPIASLQDLQREGKSKKIFYATTGVGTNGHLTGALLSTALGIEMEPVHYQGGAAAMADLGGGRVDIYFATTTEVQMGIGKPIAVTTVNRSSAFPNVPTVAEAGFPKAQVNSWWGGVFAPAGTPKNVVAKINEDVLKVMTTAEATAFLVQQGFKTPTKMSVEEFTALVTGEVKDLTALADSLHLRGN